MDSRKLSLKKYAAVIAILIVLVMTVLDDTLVNALCGIGFGLFQTPNNIVMVIATPIQRTGGAGGMQSTARLV